MYLFRGNQDTMYRIHGTNQPWSIGLNLSSGCFRMMNRDVEDLYNRVSIGTKVIVIGPGDNPGRYLARQPAGYSLRRLRPGKFLASAVESPPAVGYSICRRGLRGWRFRSAAILPAGVRHRPS